MAHLYRVGVLRGGPSSEYDVSLQSGASVLSALETMRDMGYRPIDILVSRDGVWHIDGAPVEPHQALSRVDVVFNALHGNYGEDGKVQHFLESHNMPFTGSGSLASAVGMNKILTKRHLKAHNIKTPYHIEISRNDIAHRLSEISHKLFQSVILPAIVKPVSGGSSVGVTLVKDYDKLPEALLLAADHSDAVMIEEFIRGDEATCGVIEGFRSHELYALPPVEIRPKSPFFDFKAKYHGHSEEIVPSTFPDKVKKELESLAAQVHRALGLRHYSRTDFMIHPKRGIYVLEVNTLPGLTKESLVPKSLRAVGSDTHQLVEHLIKLAMNRKI